MSIGAKLEVIHARVSRAMCPMVFMLVQKKISRAGLLEVATEFERTAKEIRELVK